MLIDHLLFTSDGPLFAATAMMSMVFVVILARFVLRRDPLGDLPGPFLARWTSLWLAYQVRMGRRYLIVDGLHKVCHHPPLVW